MAGGPVLPGVRFGVESINAEQDARVLRNTPTAARGYVGPARTGWWNEPQANGFGQQRAVTLSMVGAPVPVTSVDFAGPPQLWTVALSRLDVPSADNSDVQAVIEWGSGGGSDSVLVDWVRGTMVSVPGTFVRVYAVGILQNPDAAFAGRAVTLAATIGAGERPNAGLGPSLTQWVSLGAGSNVDGVIPRYARELSVAGRLTAGGSPYDANTLVTLRGLVGGLPVAEYRGNELGPGTVIPVPGWARVWNVASAVAARQISLRWGLAL